LILSGFFYASAAMPDFIAISSSFLQGVSPHDMDCATVGFMAGMVAGALLCLPFSIACLLRRRAEDDD
jgi:hypothetical protein